MKILTHLDKNNVFKVRRYGYVTAGSRDPRSQVGGTAALQRTAHAQQYLISPTEFTRNTFFHG